MFSYVAELTLCLNICSSPKVRDKKLYLVVCAEVSMTVITIEVHLKIFIYLFILHGSHLYDTFRTIYINDHLNT